MNTTKKPKAESQQPHCKTCKKFDPTLPTFAGDECENCAPLSPSAKLDAVRAWVVKACPDLIYVVAPGAPTRANRETIYGCKPITLAEVLRAMDTANIEVMVQMIDDTCTFVVRKSSIEFKWNYLADLDHQSADLINFLYSLRP